MKICFYLKSELNLDPKLSFYLGIFFSTERQLLIGQKSVTMEENCGKCTINALEIAQLRKDLENMEKNLIAAVGQLSLSEM